ncbi:hypothetical protein BGW41_000298 [Actinomortierella wolfii]|nr:hypothetical protein BGW41_000298 [Actinomortierella wolfii]
MLEVSVEDRWVALSDDGAIKESLPITTNHADNQLQHLEKVGHISPNGNLSPSSPRVSTLARKRGVHQSTGPKLTSDASDGPTSCSSLEPGATTQNSNKCYRSNTRSGSMFMCPVCLKNYANNSTLRRHLKIHAYACSAAVAAAATAAATTSATSTTTTPPTRGVSPSPLSTDYTFAGLASGKQPQTRLLSPVGVDTDTREVSIIDASGNGYPSDITLMSTSSLEPITSAASPLLTVYEPTLTSHRSMISTTSSSPTSSPTYSSLSSSSTISNPSSSSSLTPSYSSSSSSSSSSFLSMPALATTSALLSSSILQYRPGIDTDYRKPECVGCNKAFARRDTVILHIKNIRRKWEIHWREQKMKSGGDSSGSSYGHYFEPEMYDVLRTKVKEKEDEKEEEDDVELDDKKKKARSRNCARTQSGNDADVADFINDSSEYLSEEATITDHSITSDYKRQRVMKKEPGSPLPASPKQPQSMFTKEEEKELLRELARASACYRERKVRMFGSFGMVEEPVLQD